MTNDERMGEQLQPTSMGGGSSPATNSSGCHGTDYDNDTATTATGYCCPLGQSFLK